MSRTVERLIDLTATALLLLAGYLMDNRTPGLAGVVTYAAVQFWLQKNATRRRGDESNG